MTLVKAHRAGRGLLTVCGLGTGVLLLVQSEVAAEGVRKGIELCLDTVIPSLFIFMVFCDLLSGAGTDNILLRPFGLLARLYRLPEVTGPALLLGVIGGYPIGARMAVSMKREGRLSGEQAGRLLTVAYGASPAFMAGVGWYVFGSGKLGLALWGCQLAACVLTGALMARFYSADHTPSYVTEGGRLGERFVGAVVSAVRGMGIICGFVVVFSVAGSYLNLLPGEVGRWITAGLEVSVGCSTARGMPYWIAILCITGCCSLGGVSVWLQNACFLRGSGISMRLFFVSRLVHLPVSILLTLAADKLFGFSGWAAEAVFSSFGSTVAGQASAASIGSGNLVSSVFLVVCCLMLLPGGRKVCYNTSDFTR